MFAKAIAVALLVLAVSPLTQPFSTVSPGELERTPQPRTFAEDAVGASQPHVTGASYPGNLPVELRSMERAAEREPALRSPLRGLGIALPVAAAPVALAGQTRHALLQHRHRPSSRASSDTSAVLRL
jgi:hypothetical protein